MLIIFFLQHETDAGVKESQLTDLIVPKQEPCSSIINELGSTRLIDHLTNIIQLACMHSKPILNHG